MRKLISLLILLTVSNIPIHSQSTSLSVIYRTQDSGKSWTSFSNGIPSDATVSGFETHGNKIYVSTDFHGVYVSENGEDRWTSINNGLPEDLDINCILATGGKLILGTFRQGIFFSDAEKVHWRASNSAIANTPIRALTQVGNTLLAGTDNGIYESFDLGKSWKNILPEIQILGFTSLYDKVYAGVMNGAMLSNDKGKTWQYIYQPDALHDISNDGEYVYVMTLGNGLMRSNNDGQTWENANTGMGTLNLYTFELKNIDHDLFAAQWYGIYHSTNRGNQWTLVDGLPDSTAFSTLEVTNYGLLAGIAIRK